MSYEGYSQFLCKKGHCWELDCNIADMEGPNNRCPSCKGPAVWENMVDITNGSHDDAENYVMGRLAVQGEMIGLSYNG